VAPREEAVVGERHRHVHTYVQAPISKTNTGQQDSFIRRFIVIVSRASFDHERVCVLCRASNPPRDGVG